MQLDVHIVIDAQNEINILVPDLPHKETYCRAPSTTLHHCDKALTRYIGSTSCLDLSREDVCNTLYNLYKQLVKSLYIKTIPKNASAGSVGKELSKILADDHADTSDIFDCLVWDHCIPIATLLYSTGNKIYIEIAPLYPWALRSVKTHEKHTYYPREVHLQQYTPYVWKEISRKQAISWKNQIYNALEPVVRGCRDDLLTEETRYTRNTAS